VWVPERVGSGRIRGARSRQLNETIITALATSRLAAQLEDQRFLSAGPYGQQRRKPRDCGAPDDSIRWQVPATLTLRGHSTDRACDLRGRHELASRGDISGITSELSADVSDTTTRCTPL